MNSSKHFHQKIPRSQHTISRSNISSNALKVLYKINNEGFKSHLVGGGVRDLLLGIAPKDFDVVTDASPKQIKKLFSNCRLIGRRFRLAHVFFGREIIEVATFRANPENIHEDGRIALDNIFGTINEDAWRRDFTINSLYYDINDFSVIDYTGGLEDLQNKMVRIIGDPTKRYLEDPVRMLRGIRLAAKLGFTLERQTLEPIANLGTLLNKISSTRLFDEFSKWILSGKSLTTYELLKQNNIFDVLFPQTVAAITQNPQAQILLWNGFNNTDLRLQENKSINPAFILVFGLWEVLLQKLKSYPYQKKISFNLLNSLIDEILRSQTKIISFPNYLLGFIKDVWLMQFIPLVEFERYIGNTPHSRIRAAYDFLLLREQAGEKIDESIRKNLVEKIG